MGVARDPEVVDWLSAPETAPIRYLTARDLVEPAPSAAVLKKLRAAALAWPPLQEVLELQLDDGSFPYRQKTPTAQPTFSGSTRRSGTCGPTTCTSEAPVTVPSSGT
jgi:hypothetical protein